MEAVTNVSDDHCSSFETEMPHRSSKVSTALSFYSESPTMDVDNEFEQSKIKTDWSSREVKLLKDVNKFRLLYEKSKNKVKRLYQNKRRNKKAIDSLKSIVKSIEDKKLRN